MPAIYIHAHHELDADTCWPIAMQTVSDIIEVSTGGWQGCGQALQWAGTFARTGPGLATAATVAAMQHARLFASVAKEKSRFSLITN